MKIKAVIWQEDGVWCGSVPALKGCHTWGDSYEHLLEMLEVPYRLGSKLPVKAKI
jgi:predicted RNase H-like HicB family nuclease